MAETYFFLGVIAVVLTVWSVERLGAAVLFAVKVIRKAWRRG